MKKVLLSFAIVAALFSCKKEDPKTFTATGTTGTTMVTGKITQDVKLDDGNGVSTIKLPKAGVEVTITVANSALYPNSTAKGSKTYTGTSDANGDYSISVTTNGDGVRSTFTFHNYYATVDTITSTDTLVGEMALYRGTSYTQTLTTDVNASESRNYMSTTIIGGTTPNYTIGSAVVSGILYVEKVQQDTNVIGDTLYYNDNFPLAGHLVTLIYDQDPTTLVKRTYTATTDAEGLYSFMIETVESHVGLDDDAEIFVIDYPTTRDTVLINESIVTGDAGVFNNESRTENNIESTNVRINNNLYYDNFTKQD